MYMVHQITASCFSRCRYSFDFLRAPFDKNNTSALNIFFTKSDKNSMANLYSGFTLWNLVEYGRTVIFQLSWLCSVILCNWTVCLVMSLIFKTNTVETRYNDLARDWQHLFAMKRFRYIEVLFHIFYYYWGEGNRSLYRGLRYIEVCYIEVPLYQAPVVQWVNSAIHKTSHYPLNNAIL